MPKAEGSLTPKAIANRIKAKGLQKLKWYCQMCEKQCRDENGFKCHCMSEQHQRQMALFQDNAKTYMDQFSKEFEQGMLEIIQRRARSKRVNANDIYRDYISDRHHLHMNATIWETLTDFVMYLGRTGKCQVDETERGWYIMYIDRDPETLRKLEARAKRERSDLAADEKHERDLMRQAKFAREALGEDPSKLTATEIQRERNESKVTFSAAKPVSSKGKSISSTACSIFNDSREADGQQEDSDGGKGAKSKSLSGIVSLIESEERRKERNTRLEYWLFLGIIVNVLNKQLAQGKYYKQKGTIEEVVDRYTAHVRMHATGDLIRLHQKDLETVIPSEGSTLLVVNGAHRGATATLLRIDLRNFCVSIQVRESAHTGRILDNVPYEDVCTIDRRAPELPIGRKNLKIADFF